MRIALGKEFAWKLSGARDRRDSERHSTRLIISVMLLTLLVTGIQSLTNFIPAHAQYQLPQGMLTWKYTTGGPGSTVNVGGGIVYNYSSDGNVYALNASTGELIWEYYFGPIYGNPPHTALANNIFYIGADQLVALNATTGSLLWSNNPGTTANPVVVNNVLYVTAGTAMIAMNPMTGATIWSSTFSNGDSIVSPVISNGFVYSATHLTDMVYAFNANTGAQVWSTSVPGGNIAATPVAVNGTLYVAPDSNLVALNASTGALLWDNSSFTAWPQGDLIYADGLVFDSTGGGIIAANASNGAVVWLVNCCGPSSGISYSSGVLYMYDKYGNLWAFNADYGFLIWEYSTGAIINWDNPGNLATPAIYDGGLYFGASDHNVYAIGEPPPSALLASELYGLQNLTENPCSCSRSDPVNTETGNFTETYTDFSIPGRGIPLRFSRTYNSLAASQYGPLGYGWTDSYNMSLSFDQATGNVTINQENGSTITFSPYGALYLAPARVLGTLVKNGDGTYTFTRYQGLDQYTFSATGQLIKETDRNGYTTSLTYTNSQLTAITDPAGRSLNISYTANGQIATVSDPMNHVVTFSYDVNGNLSSVLDVNGGTTTFTYDPNHLLRTITDPNKNVATTNVYDANNRVISQTDALNRKTTFSYGANVTTTTYPNGNQSVDTYQNGLLTQTTEGYGTPQAATTSYTYDPLTNAVTSKTDPNGNVTTSTWDANGNLLSQTDPLQHTTSSTYDSTNDRTSLTDPKGNTTTYSYDSHGNLLTVAQPMSRTTSYTYGDTQHPGDVTAMQDPNSNTWTSTYDAYGDKASATDPLGDKTTWQYNIVGWVTSSVSPDGNVTGGNPSAYTTSYTYDHFGNVKTITDPLGHVTYKQYDSNQNLLKLTDADNNLTQYKYDAGNELIKITQPDTSTINYTYDGNGNQLTQKDGLGNTTSYTYDALNRVTSITDPLSRKTGYSYDLDGNMKAKTDPSNNITTYTYNHDNELTGITYSDGHTPNVSYTYDSNGNRLTMTDGTGTTTDVYDALNRLTQETNGAGALVKDGYDLNGNLTEIIYPNGQKVSYSYDTANRMYYMKDWTSHSVTYTLDANGNLVSAKFPNNIRMAATFDANNQPANMQYYVVNTSPFLNFTYTRDHMEQITATQTTGTIQSSDSYGYTPLNQLSTDNTTSYAYDHGDNITTAGTNTLNYDPANEVTSLVNTQGTTSYSYDTRGNRTQVTAPSQQTTNLTYDQANRLTAYGTSATYAYNGDGLRMSKTVNGTTEQFAWNTATGLPMLLTDGNTNFIYGPGNTPLEQVASNGSVYFYYHDALGSTRAMSDTTGAIVATYSYDAYGNLTASTGSVYNPLQYTGQYVDSESGFVYLWARYYDPVTSNFISQDPINNSTHHPYSYSNNNPVNLADPMGLFTIGPCFSANLILFVGVGYQGCFQVINGHDVVYTSTPEYPMFDIFGTASLSFSPISISNADCISELNGDGVDFGGSIGNGASVGFDGSVSRASDGKVIVSAAPTYSPDRFNALYIPPEEVLPMPFEAHTGVMHTTAYHLFNLPSWL